MCPTLEQILSRSLMRGKIPLPSASGMKEVNLSSIPSLRVPQAKPAPVHRTASPSATTATSSDSSSSTTTTSTSANKKSSSGNPPSSRQDSVVAAFAGLSTPHFSPDPREKICERPVRGGLRSLQDLPSLLESACILDEWKSALAALDGAIDLVTGAHNANATFLHHDQQQEKRQSSPSSLFSIRKLIPLTHFVAAARVCQSNGAAGAFEKCMNEKISQLSDAQSLGTEAESKSVSKKKMKYDLELSEITTETLVESGSWELALQRYEKLCQEGKQTVGSLNSCISACSAKPQLWSVALKLAEPAMASREAEIAENLILTSINNNNGEIENKNVSVSKSSSSVPLSHFGSSTNSQKITDASVASSSASANAITYAALISTLENCGRPIEAAKILKSAPASDREVVMASYVALLKVWSDTHGKKSMRRF